MQAPPSQGLFFLGILISDCQIMMIVFQSVQETHHVQEKYSEFRVILNWSRQNRGFRRSSPSLAGTFPFSRRASSLARSQVGIVILRPPKAGWRIVLGGLNGLHPSHGFQTSGSLAFELFFSCLVGGDFRI